jgi:hypothetical protein
MPKVGAKKFDYTVKGRDQAKQYRKRLKKKAGYKAGGKKVMKPKY